MSRYRINYSKSKGSWVCDIYDYKKEESWSGKGDTRKSAKDDAFYNVYNYQSDTYSNSNQDPVKETYMGLLFGFLVVGAILGVIIASVLVILKWLSTGNSFPSMLSELITFCFYGIIAGSLFGVFYGIYDNHKKKHSINFTSLILWVVIIAFFIFCLSRIWLQLIDFIKSFGFSSIF